MTEQRDLQVNDAHREVDGVAQRFSDQLNNNRPDVDELLQALNAFKQASNAVIRAALNPRVVVQDCRDLEMGTLGSPGSQGFILFNFKLTI